VQIDPAGRVRAGVTEPTAKVRANGGGAARRHEADLPHAGHGGIHGLHPRAVRHPGTSAAGHPVQPVDVQRAVVHSRSAARQEVACCRVPAAVELQHDFLRVAQHQVPDRRGSPVRHQSLPPGPGRRVAAFDDRPPPAAHRHH